MFQHFDQPQSRTPHQTPLTPSFVPDEPTASLVGDPVFAALSPQGQKTVSGYLAHVERGLQTGPVGPGYFDFEQAETLHELQTHLLSLIVAYQEIGDEEQAAVASALAQFGKSHTVSGDLRRAQARNHVARVLRKNDYLLPAVLLPALFYNVSFLLSFLTRTTPVALGWHVLLLVPFLCGVINANLSRKWSLHGIFMGVAAATATFTLLDMAFNGINPVMLGAMGAALVPWLGSACLGMVFAHTADVLSRKAR